MITTGLDLGSRNTKIVLYDNSNSSIVFHDWIATDVKPLNTVEYLLKQSSPTYSSSFTGGLIIGVTGYGRKLVPNATRVLSEISCHAKGVTYYYPNVRTIIDIGGQDSKIILVNENGRVDDFLMNDKCAAGTGRFLEMTAMRLGVSVEQMNEIDLSTLSNVSINSTCVVFAESEIIGLIAENASTEDIVNAVFNSIVRRILAQLNTIKYQSPIVFTGGVAQCSPMVNSLSMALETEVLVPPLPEITGALGAAILVSI